MLPLHHANLSLSPFELVSLNLRKIGALTLREYLSESQSEDSSLTNTHHPSTFETGQTSRELEGSASKGLIRDPEYISKLESAFNSAFPASSIHEGLRYEIVRRSGGPNAIQCILTVTRPDGAYRVYESLACHSRNYDAETQVAEMAVSQGAVDFILQVDNQIEDLPVQSATGQPSSTDFEVEDDSQVRQIQNALREHRPGNRPPDWIFYCTDSQPPRWGVTLRVHLDPPRLYVLDMICETKLEAISACAKLALDQGIVDHIINSTTVTLEESPPKLTVPTSLQTWFEALSGPRPEFFGTKMAVEIGAAALLNEWVTKARGARFKLNFFWPMDIKNELLGCILRVDRPGESRAYVVDPMFTKRSDAKAAVCLSAMVQGIENIIKAVSAQIENKLTPELRSFAHNKIFPALGLNTPGMTYTFKFHMDIDAYGCTLTVCTGSSEHKYSVEPEYRTKADAKVAVALAAAERGLLELLRSCRKRQPVAHQGFGHDREQSEPVFTSTQKKRKADDDNSGEKAEVNKARKKRKKGNKGKESTDAVALVEGHPFLAEVASKGGKGSGKRPAIAQGQSPKPSTQPIPKSGPLEPETYERSQVAPSSSGLPLRPPRPPPGHDRSQVASSSSGLPLRPPPPPPPPSGHNLPPRPRPLPYDIYGPPPRPPPLPYDPDLAAPSDSRAPQPKHYPYQVTAVVMDQGYNQAPHNHYAQGNGYAIPLNSGAFRDTQYTLDPRR
ncbi:hypothetical protein H0H81_008498 [Sphagnurus paluster]|uniref:Uncharacterized protein n=1 Tax=Sphagnurus paluster TaxID=117069 RepID=A0A9P7K4N4_9AGAR|nr:hypothetical protein H0H81_008498 [Sphagnurus paluster]